MSIRCAEPSIGNFGFFPDVGSQFFDDTWSLVVQACAAYSIACVVYRYVPSTISRKGPQKWLDYTQAAWNLGMCVFSTTAAVSSWPVIRRSDCQIWLFLYCLSKPLEFMDTVWLMAKGKSILTLHWTHHVFTFLFTWQAAMQTENFYGVMMGVVNLTVHSIMYGYFFLTMMCPRVQRYKRYITYIQLSQFAFILLSMPFWKMSHGMRLMAVSMYGYYLTQFAKLLTKPKPMCELCGRVETSAKCVICKLRTCHGCKSEGNGMCRVCEIKT